jgi:putative peptide zinc metalloprotease protein
VGETHPKLRSDLEIRSESPQPLSALLVKDPIVKRFYRFSSVQGAVLRLLDGQHDVATIAARASEECRTPVGSSQVEDFVGKLRGLLLLDHEACWSKLEASSSAGTRTLDNVLSIKLRAFNPDALLGRLERRLRFCFTAGFVAFVLAAMGAAFVLTILNWESLYVSLGSLFNLYSIPLILIVALAVTTLHEFGHGLTLKHFGGKVEEMGFLLLYFMPAFYCNVSDAWMLGKAQRVWVTIAGGFIQLFVWALATIAWRLLAPEVFASQVCVVVIAFSGIQTLFNFNPLIRLDGYYLLSDYLEVPNLRPKAFRFLRERLSRALLGTSEDQTTVTKREKRIFWRYGVASFLFSAALVTIGASRLAGWLVRNYQTWGLALFSGFALLSVQIASKEVVATGRFLGALGERIRKTPRLLIVSGLFVGGTFLPWELKISGDFTVKPAERVSVASQMEGTIKAVRADEGKRVHRGEVLAELENLSLKNDYDETRGEIVSKEASLKLLQAGTRPEEITKALKQLETKQTELANATRIQEERASLVETVKKKEAEVKNAKEVYERTSRLKQEGLIPQNDLEREQTNYEVKSRELTEAQAALKVLQEKTDRTRQLKRKEVEEAQSQLDLLRAGSRQEAIDAAKAEVDRLTEKKNNLEQQLGYLRICSTIDGVVSTPYLGNKVGEYIKKGEFFCEVVNLGTMLIDMPVPEKEIADVRPGFPIALKVRGYPKLSFQGRVTTISPVALESGSERKVLVKSELANDEGLLKAGMTGVGKILCGKRMIAELLSRRAVRWLRTEFWEYLP